MASSELKARYNALDDQQEFRHAVGAAGTNDVLSNQTYLSSLRSSTRKLQEEVNMFLTAKMEDDKRANAVTSSNNSGDQRTGTKDEEEEANYGEEKIEDE